jgi:dTDP-4-amino-4,6-dideoxygalactose transaminase
MKRQIAGGHVEQVNLVRNLGKDLDPVSPTPVYVTRPCLPPFEEFLPYLRRIWDSGILTNGGPLHEQLERALGDYLGIKRVALVANGTLGLLIALKAIGIRGEVITTPYTFVATAHALKWLGLEPVFVDIDPHTLNLDPGRIESAITPRTTAILPVHCYGNACKVDEIGALAGRHGLKLVYDAAHAFGVQDDGGSLLRHGDLSVLSFHATKTFSTFEGGAIVCHDDEMLERIRRLRNFGIADAEHVPDVGINGKMSEIAAALGLVQLGRVDAMLARQKSIDLKYRAALRDIPGIRCLGPYGQKVASHGYFPVMVEEAYPLTRDELHGRLREAGVHARRYFFPLVTAFPMYADLPSAAMANLPVAARAAAQVICLPIFADLTDAQQSRVVDVVRRFARS